MKIETVKRSLAFNTFTTYRTGAEACFVKLNKQYGVKLFNDKNTRNSAVKNQTYLSKKGVAPKVYASFAIRKKQLEDSRIYEIWIEIENHNNTNPWIYGFITEVVRQRRKVKYEKLRYLTNQLKSLGFRTFDIWEPNVGYKNGRLVLVDCNPLSLGPE